MLASVSTSEEKAPVVMVIPAKSITAAYLLAMMAKPSVLIILSIIILQLIWLINIVILANIEI